MYNLPESDIFFKISKETHTQYNEICFYKWEKVGCWDGKIYGIVKESTSKKDGMLFNGELVRGWNYESVDEMVKGCNGERVK